MSNRFTISLTEFQLLRDYIEQHSGISLSDDKMYLIETRLSPLMVESGFQSYRDFYHFAIQDSS
ncbi:MAG: protein-glutamate O-methyltransferase CheR, partial [Desulfobulbaceae bacterium]|nr:protein-glutamate O-methyltransferase CheR [Desulfobulbaceae bacterium]